MWKWCTAIHQMTWIWDAIISLLFWTILYPFEDGIYHSNLAHWCEFMDHICPLTLTTIDWILGSMRYEKTTIWINIAAALIYGVVNIVFTKVTGEPVYPPFIVWDSFGTWMIGLSIIPLWILFFYLEYWATNWKLSKLSKEKEQPTLL